MSRRVQLLLVVTGIGLGTGAVFAWGPEPEKGGGDLERELGKAYSCGGPPERVVCRERDGGGFSCKFPSGSPAIEVEDPDHYEVSVIC